MLSFARQFVLIAPLWATFAFAFACGGVAENDPSFSESDASGKNSGDAQGGLNDDRGVNGPARPPDHGGEPINGGGGDTGYPAPADQTYGSVLSNCTDACLEYMECGIGGGEIECGCEENVSEAQAQGCLNILNEVFECLRSDPCAAPTDSCAEPLTAYVYCAAEGEIPPPPDVDRVDPFEEVYVACQASCEQEAFCSGRDPASCGSGCWETANSVVNVGCVTEYRLYSECVVDHDACLAAEVSCPEELDEFSDCFGAIR